ncbi:MAG: Uma2 family endonuclease [Cyanobacteria bacterium J06649_4]
MAINPITAKQYTDSVDIVTDGSIVEEEEENYSAAFCPDPNELITEDDAPVDNFPSAKQQRLLVGSLYSALPNVRFLAEANVGVYYQSGVPAIVPDVFVSFDVEVPENWWDKPNRCYLVWNFGKPPEIALEIVSNQVGNELSQKLEIYERMRASYYVLYDPAHKLSEKTLRVFELRARHYTELSEHWMEQVQLGLTLWEGAFEGRLDTWLRWCDKEGTVLLTGDEKAERESQRAEQESQRAEQESQRADRLAALLKEQGIDISDI